MFHIQLQGFVELQNMLRATSAIETQFFPEFESAISEFHEKLSLQVNKEYNTAEDLTKYLVGRPAIRSIGKLSYSGELAYWEKALPIASFVSSVSFIPAPDNMFFLDEERNWHKRKSPIQKLNVTIRIGKEKPLLGKQGYGGFFYNDGNAVGMRSNEATWTTAERLNRAKYFQVKTLGVASMASHIFDSGIMDKELDKMQERLANSFIEALSNV